MKSYARGIITGFLISAAVFAAPAIAENINALFNDVRINVNGIDQIQWGENIELGNGETTPSSILYNGTTYLPMRKLGELSGQQIYWNGDSKTVAMTGKQKDINVVAEKPDKNGNVWKYYTFTDDNYTYLGVKDEARGYERVYRIATMNGGEPVRVTDEAIYFIRRSPYMDCTSGIFMKLSFDNDADTQDGMQFEELRSASGATPTIGCSAFEKNILYYSYTFVHSNYNHSEIAAYDYENNKIAIYSLNTYFFARNIRMESDSEKIIFTYELIGSGQSQGNYSVVFDKKSFTFGKAYKTEVNNETN